MLVPGPSGHSSSYRLVPGDGQGSQGVPQPMPFATMLSMLQQHMERVTGLGRGFRHWPALILL